MTQPGGDWLIGREAERAAIQQAIAASRQTGTAVLVGGEAGIGKSALVRELLRQAAAGGIAMLRCRPAESEAAYAYAALDDLAGGPFDRHAGDLPPPQREALAQALHRAAPSRRPRGRVAEPATAGTVAAGLTTLLRAAAARGPLAIVIDDVQWLDQPTGEALRFALRRLLQPGVLVAVAWRDELDRRGGIADPLGVRDAFGGGQVFQLELTGLTTGALHALLQRDLGLALPRRRLVELHELTRGNPLYALEIGRLLARHADRGATGQPLPLPGSLAQLMSSRIDAAPAAAIEVLEVVALAGRPSVTTLDQLAGSGEKAEQMVEAAMTAGLVELDGERIRPAHPLLASAALSAMSPPRRRRLHGRLAALVSDPEARARHLALASAGPDRGVAVALELAATAAHRRGAVDSAVDLLGMAVERTLTADADDLRRRRLMLGQALLDSGDLPAAGRLADELLADDHQHADRGRLALLRATVAWYLEPSQAAVGYLLDALQHGLEDTIVEGRIHMHLAVFFDFDLRRARQHGLEAVRLLDAVADHDAVSAGALATALCQLFYSEVLLGLRPRDELITRALSIEPLAGRTDRSTVPGLWWAATDRLGDAWRRFEGQLELSRQTGDLSGEADLLTRLAEVELWQERWGAAAELAEQSVAAARQAGHQTPEPALRVRAWVDACRGDLAKADRTAAEALDRLDTAEGSILAAAWLVVAVFVAATQGDAARVDRLARRSAAHLRAIGIVEPLRLDVTGEHLAALCQLGRLDEARALLHLLVEREQRIPRAALRAAIARGRALLAAAEGQLAVAVDGLGSVSEAPYLPRLEQARCLLLRGQLQRRMRDRRGARTSLEAALARFEALGAGAWAGQALAELGRLGSYRPGTLELTPAEREVAVLAAAGLPTRKVAERLFMSPKTVEAHLTHIYGKLGISSRAELGARMAQLAPADGAPTARAGDRPAE